MNYTRLTRVSLMWVGPATVNTKNGLLLSHGHSNPNLNSHIRSIGRLINLKCPDKTEKVRLPPGANFDLRPSQLNWVGIVVRLLYYDKR